MSQREIPQHAEGTSTSLTDIVTCVGGGGGTARLQVFLKFATAPEIYTFITICFELLVFC